MPKSKLFRGQDFSIMKLCILKHILISKIVIIFMYIMHEKITNESECVDPLIIFLA
jgi:hypothetical protein